MLDVITFWIFALIITASAIGVVTSREVMHSALFLALFFIMVAVFYILLNAEFLAAVQILVYTGGVITMIVFAVILTGGKAESKAERKAESKAKIRITSKKLMLPACMSVIFLLLMAGIIKPPVTSSFAYTLAMYPLTEFGTMMLTTYLFPFEAISLVLLVAIIGAIILAKK